MCTGVHGQGQAPPTHARTTSATHQNGSDAAVGTPWYVITIPPVAGLLLSRSATLMSPVLSTWQSAEQHDALWLAGLVHAPGGLHWGVAPHVWTVGPYTYVLVQLAGRQACGARPQMLKLSAGGNATQTRQARRGRHRGQQDRRPNTHSHKNRGRRCGRSPQHTRASVELAWLHAASGLHHASGRVTLHAGANSQVWPTWS